MPDEMAFAGRENLDPGHAARYDAKEDAGAKQELADLLELGIGPGSTVVDLGAGTGQFVMEAAAAVRRVVAVDVSAVMLERLEAKVKAAGAGNVELVQAGFLTYAHTGAPADLVYSRYALHHLPDFWKAVALSRMSAMLRPGGLLRLWDVVYGFLPGQAEQRLQAWVESLPATGGPDDWTRADLVEHVRDENSTFTWLLEPMLQRAGLQIERTEYSDDGMFARYLCVNEPA